MSASDRQRVSIVTPCYNEEETLPTLFRRLANVVKVLREDYDVEVVFVDDGSTDGTRRLLVEHYAGEPSVRIVCHERNEGFGTALRSGLLATTGDIVVTVDADTNYDQQEIPALLSYLGDDVDIVTASPFAPGGRWHYPLHRFWTSRGVVHLYHLVLRGLGDDIHTFTSGFRAYRRTALEKILPEATDFLASAEMLVRAILHGYRIAEYPTAVYDRKFGVSKLRTIRTIRSHLGLLWRVYHGTVLR